MNALHKEALRRNHLALTANLDPEDIIGYLYQERALSDEECEDILCSPTRRRRAWKLLYHLRNRDPCRKPYHVFVDSLKQDHGFLAEMLENTVEELCQGDHITEHSEGSWDTTDAPKQTVGMVTADSVPGGKRHKRKGKRKLSGYDINCLASYLRSQLLSDEDSLSDGTDDLDSNSDVPVECEEAHVEAQTKSCSDFSDDGPQTWSETDSTRAEDDQFRERFGRYVVGRLQELRGGSVEGQGESADPLGHRGHHGLAVIQKSVSQCMTPATRTGRNRDASMKYMFDKVYSLIQSGCFDVEGGGSLSVNLRPADADLKCMILYVEASTLLYQGEIKASERVLKKLLKLVPFTSVPSKVIVEVSSLRCWISIKENKLQALEDQVRDAIQTILVDPIRCSGRAAAWVLVEEARRMASLMSNNDLSRAYELRDKAIETLYQSLDHFQQENNSDGLLGCCFVSIRLSAMKLACGEYMQTIDLQPTEEDIQSSSGFLKEVAKHEQEMPDVLRLNFTITMSDLYFRRHDLGCALNNSKCALGLAKQLGLSQETRSAQARFDFLKGLCDQSMATPPGKGRRWCDRRPRDIRLWYSADNSTTDTESDVWPCYRVHHPGRRRISWRSKKARKDQLPAARPLETADSSTESGTPLVCARQFVARKFTFSSLRAIQPATPAQLRPKISLFVRIWVLIVIFSGCWVYKNLEY